MALSRTVIFSVLVVALACLHVADAIFGLPIFGPNAFDPAGLISGIPGDRKTGFACERACRARCYDVGLAGSGPYPAPGCYDYCDCAYYLG